MVNIFNSTAASEKSNIEFFRKAKHIPNLDGLRAIAILLVLIHHIPPISLDLLKNFQKNAGSGVQLFFIISGFLITTLALREVRETGRFSLWNFYVRRTLRLFPLYYTVLAFVCFLVFYLDVYTQAQREVFQERLLSYVFYYSNLITIKGPFSLLWSLAVEEQFYFMFSMLFFFFKKRITGIAILVILFFQHQPFDSLNLISESLIPDLVRIIFYFFESIFMGVLLAYAFDNPTMYRLFQKFFKNTFTLICVVICVVFYLFNSFENYNFYYILLTILVGICALSPPLPFIGGKFMSHIGKISYGIYLTHTIIFFGIKDIIGLHPFWVLFLGTPIVILAATLIYNYFEKPFLVYKEKFCVVHSKS